jgi:hypothetical protein
MTTLVEEMARAIETETEKQREPGTRPMALTPIAQAALDCVLKKIPLFAVDDSDGNDQWWEGWNAAVEHIAGHLNDAEPHLDQERSRE